jgi:hypothetical protein
MQTNRFWIILLVRVSPSGPPSQFAFNSIPSLEKQGIDVGRDDILQNFKTKESQMMNGTRERNPLLLQMLIEVASQPGDLVLDCTSATGNPLPSLRPNLNILCHVILRIGYAKFFTLFFFDWGFYHCLSEAESIHCGLGGR